MTAPSLPAALAYAERGWFVFPLKPGSKLPAFPLHRERDCDRTDQRCRAAGRHLTWEDRATTDPDRIERAWTAKPYGIGIACGPSGLVVIDLDRPKTGPDGTPAKPPAEWALPGVLDGLDVLAVLADRARQPCPIGSTHTVSTPSGGTHLYFTTPDAHGEHGEPLRNTAGGLGWLIDTRAHGGYVAAPPTHLDPNPAIGGSGGAYQITVHAPAAPLPAWLADALTPAPLPPQEAVSARLRASGDHRRDAYLTAAVRGQLDAITTAQPGGRNRALYLSATALGQLTAGGELRSAEVAGWLETAAIAAGLSPHEIDRTIRSGMTAGAKRPRTITTPPREGAAA